MSRSIAGKQVAPERTVPMMFNFANQGDWERIGAQDASTAIEMWNSIAAASWKAWLGFCFPWTVGQGQQPALAVMSKGIAKTRAPKRAKRR